MTRQAGLGKFEFAVVLAIFGVLAAILLDRLVALEQETERVTVDLTLRHIDVGIKLAIGERMMRGEEAKIPALLDENPLNFLGQPKVGAGGTAAAGTAALTGTASAGAAALAGTAPGNWDFEPGRRILSYRPRQPEAFAGRERLDWRYTGHTDELGRMTGLRLEPVK